MQSESLPLQILIKNRFYVATKLPKVFCFQSVVLRLTASKQCMYAVTDRSKEFLNTDHLRCMNMPTIWQVIYL